MSIEELNMSVRAFNIVCRQGIHTVEELQAFLNAPDFDENILGRKTTAEVRERLQEMEGNMIQITTKLPPAPAEAATPEYLEAFNLNARIHYCKEGAETLLGEMCRCILKMHEKKQYKVLGYQNFDDYCREQFNFSKQQGIKYVRVGKMLEEQNDNPGCRFDGLGIKKLNLLAMMDEDDRQTIMETVDVQTVNVKELQTRIKELEAARDSKHREWLEATNEVTRLSEEVFRTQEQLDAMRAERDKENANACHARHETQLVRDRANQLEERVKELESRPTEHAVQEVPDPKQAARIEELERRIRLNESEYTRRIDMLKREHKTELQDAEKKASEKIAEVQSRLDDALTSAPDDVLSGNAKIDAYLDSLYDALCNVEGFLEDSRNESRLQQYVEQYRETISKSWSRVRDIIGDQFETEDDIIPF